MTDQPWREFALCRGMDPNAFYPERGWGFRHAQRFCEDCPVLLACRDYAIPNELHGVWGGLNERQRRDIRAGRRTVEQCIGTNYSRTVNITLETTP